MKLKNILPVLFICILMIYACKKDPSVQLAQTPPMGWNSFDSYGCAIYDELALKEADVFITSYAPYGYEYFVIDNGWFSNPETVIHDSLKLPISQHSKPENVTINRFGIVQPSETFFPNGFKEIVNKLHAANLKFGLHIMRGIPRKAVEQNTPIEGTEYSARDVYTTEGNCTWCTYMHGLDMSKPGAQEYLDNLVSTFAKWGVDLIKVDDITQHPEEILGYVKAIQNSGRPMILSLSPGGQQNKEYLDIYRQAHMLRITEDIWDDSISIVRSFRAWKEWSNYSEPGFWPDLDMIPFGELSILKRDYNKSRSDELLTDITELRFGGQMHHWCNFDRNEKETFITQRALAKSPLMIGGSLVSMDDHSYKLLTNKEMIACNKLGSGASLKYNDNGIEVWLSEETNKESGWIGVFNRTEKDTSYTLSSDNLNLNKTQAYSFYHIWENVSLQLNDPVEIGEGGVAFIKYEEQNPNK